MEWYYDTKREKRANPFFIKKKISFFFTESTALCYRNGSSIIATKTTLDRQIFISFLDNDNKPILSMEELFKECL
jgi:hypothetical protein